MCSAPVPRHLLGEGRARSCVQNRVRDVLRTVEHHKMTGGRGHTQRTAEPLGKDSLPIEPMT
jgi:hypothetical protein